MRRPNSIRHDAYHEAGHAIVGLALGLRVSSCWVIDEGDGGWGGRTQYISAEPERPLPEHALTIASLAGDIAGERSPYRRRVNTDTNHLLEVWDDVGPELYEALCSEARALVDEHWPDIERMAVALMRSPARGLCDLEPETWREAIAAVG